jgi:predicted transcriptional regulator YdeE
MKLKLINRNGFTICGNTVETSFETCEKDVGELWSNFRKGKSNIVFKNSIEYNKGLYGLMWYTRNHRYCYLLGKEADTNIEHMDVAGVKRVPAARYAVVKVPENMSIMEAWTVFFEKILPEADYIPDSDHGLYFEYYENEDNGTCELWTPVKENIF